MVAKFDDSMKFIGQPMSEAEKEKIIAPYEKRFLDLLEPISQEIGTIAAKGDEIALVFLLESVSILLRQGLRISQRMKEGDDGFAADI